MSHPEQIRILVEHPDPLARAGLAAAFEKCQDFAVYSSADSQAGQLGRIGAFDVVVADYSRGVALAEFAAHQQQRNAPKVMVVAGIEREWEIRRALELGVRGYYLVGCSLDDLAAGVRALHRGARYLSPAIAASLAESMSMEPLTLREEEVLRLVAVGLCNKAVGRRLGIAVGTVKSHLKSIYGKLNVESRTQAIAVAGRRGLLGQVDSAVGANVYRSMQGYARNNADAALASNAA
jgi:DNA-binding NarL/FixJ family response regulator